METTPELVGVKELAQRYGLSKDTARSLLLLLPHVKAGRSGRGERILGRPTDFEQLITKATHDQCDLQVLIQQHTPDSMRTWLYPGATA